MGSGRRSREKCPVPEVLSKYDLDGYDVDYEWNSDGAGNLVPWAPKLLHDIRQVLNRHGAQKGRHYHVAITPATPAFLHPSKEVGEWSSEFNQEAKTYPGPPLKRFQRAPENS